MLPVKLMIPIGFGVLAFCAQVLAVQALWQPGYGPAMALLWQILVALLVALAVSRILSGRLGRSFVDTFIYTCAICLFIPVVGLVLCCGVLVADLLFPAARAHKVAASSVRTPEFSAHPVSCSRQGDGANLRARVQNCLSPEQDRITAMTVLQKHPTHVTAELWEGLFSDPSRDVRQLAHGIVDDARNTIKGRISAAQAELDQTTAPDGQLRLCVRLAELHWELVYQKLVRREDHDRTLDGVARYAHDALALDQKDPEMWYLLGRCALLRNDPASAERFLQHARMCHFPVERLLPWLAEVAFLRRDYDRVQLILGAVSRVSPVPALQPIMRYWA